MAGGSARWNLLGPAQLGTWNLQTLNGKDERALAAFFASQGIAACGLVSTRVHELCDVRRVRSSAHSDADYLIFSSNFHRGFNTNRHGVALVISRSLICASNDDLVELSKILPNEAKPDYSNKLRQTLRNLTVHWFEQANADRFLRVDLDLGLGRRLILIVVLGPLETATIAVKDAFYNRLASELTEAGNEDQDALLFVLGDFNAHVGCMGPFPCPEGPAGPDDNGQRLLSLCRSFGLVIANNELFRSIADRWTWRPRTVKGGAEIAQKDFVLMPSAHLCRILDARIVGEEAPCRTESRLVTITLQMMPLGSASVYGEAPSQPWDPWGDPVRLTGAMDASEAEEQQCLSALRSTKSLRLRQASSGELQELCGGAEAALANIRSHGEALVASPGLEEQLHELERVRSLAGELRQKAADADAAAVRSGEKLRAVRRALTPPCGSLAAAFASAAATAAAPPAAGCFVALLDFSAARDKAAAVEAWLGTAAVDAASALWAGGEIPGRILHRLQLEAVAEALREAPFWSGRLQAPSRRAGRFIDGLALVAPDWPGMAKGIDIVLEASKNYHLCINSDNCLVVALGAADARHPAWPEAQQLGAMDRLRCPEPSLLWERLLSHQLAFGDVVFANLPTLSAVGSVSDERRVALLRNWLSSAHRHWWRPLASAVDGAVTPRRLACLLKCIDFFLADRPPPNVIKRLHFREPGRLWDEPGARLISRVAGAVTETMCATPWEAEERRAGSRCLRKAFEKLSAAAFLPSSAGSGRPTRIKEVVKVSSPKLGGKRLPSSLPSLGTAERAVILLSPADIDSVRPGIEVSEELVSFVLTEVTAKANGYVTAMIRGPHQVLELSRRWLDEAHTLLTVESGALFIARLDLQTVTCIDPLDPSLTSDRQETAAFMALDLEAWSGAEYRIVAPPFHSVVDQETEASVFCILYVDHLVCHRRMDTLGGGSGAEWRRRWLQRVTQAMSPEDGDLANGSVGGSV